MQKLLVIASFALVTAVACVPKPAAEELPPSGLAGAPGAPAHGSSTHATPQPSAALTSLPGVGYDVPTPAGGNTESAQLPPGHPPIDTAPTTPGAGTPSAPTGMAPPGMGSGSESYASQPIQDAQEQSPAEHGWQVLE